MARDFDDATDQRATVGSAVLTAHPITIAAWVYLSTLQQGELLYILENPGISAYVELVIRDAGGGSYRIVAGANGVGTRAFSSTALSTGQWYHACGTYTSTATRSAYTDGAGKVTNATAAGALSGLNETGVACNTVDLTATFDGRMAEIGIWSAVLDDSEILALAKGISPPLIRPQSLAAYWPLFGNASPEPDRWKSRFDLTVTGATKIEHPRIYYPHDVA